MKAWVLWVVLFAFGLNVAVAQTDALESSSSAAKADSLYYDKLVPLERSLDSEIIVKKKFSITGPLIAPFKAKKLSEVPRRLLHLVNPFARSEPKPERLNDLSPVAWSTAVGWSTGGSGFQNPVTHESHMNLISVGRANQ